MRSKIALFLAAILFFNIILPSKVFASSVQDQSKPIFGLTADQVVEKYNQLSDQQKDQVLRSLGNTSIFANSLFGNIFNSTFGVVNDAVKKLGDLFFQANGVVYKLGSSALAWVSRLIDKVFNNDLTDLNISQPVIDDFYIFTKNLYYVEQPFFVQPNKPLIVSDFNYSYVFPLPTDDFDFVYTGLSYTSTFNRFCLLKDPLIIQSGHHTYCGLVVNLDSSYISNGIVYFDIDGFGNNVFYRFYNDAYFQYTNFAVENNFSWSSNGGNSNSTWNNYSYFSNDYLSALKTYLQNYFVYAKYYILIQNNFVSKVPISSSTSNLDITNNTYYNYIYNIPDQTPLNVNNIVSNTAINYDPVENLIQYLPDNYNIEQNFSVVNNYFISSGSAISGQAIDVNIVSPGVIDVRVINPEDLTQQVTNNVSKDIINNTDVNFGDLDFSPSVTVGLNAAKDSIDGIVPVTGSSIVAQFVSCIPPDWLALDFVFLILFIVSGFGISIIRH